MIENLTKSQEISPSMSGAVESNWLDSRKAYGTLATQGNSINYKTRAEPRYQQRLHG